MTSRTRTSDNNTSMLHKKPQNNVEGHQVKDSSMNVDGNHSAMYWIMLGFGASSAIALFCAYFPFMLAPVAAKKTYHLAYWEYKEELSHFDNTAWTYGTDYGLATVMTLLAISIMRCDNTKVSSTLRFRSACLLLLYAASTLAGAIAHQNYLTLESRLTWSFRFIWTICVGTVCAASCFMGSIVSELVRQFSGMGPVPMIHENFWYTYGITTTIICIMGGLSYQRPACDIFIAGTTQTPSTFYMMAMLAIHCSNPHLVTIRRKYRAMGFIGFILNAPLLPAYPLLVQYTSLSLAAVNTLLHTNLLIAWTMQGLSLRHLCVALAEIKHEPHHALPIPSDKKRC